MFSDVFLSSFSLLNIAMKRLNKKNDKGFNNRDYSLFFLIDIFLQQLWLIPNILKWQNCKIFTKLFPSQASSRSSHQRCSVKNIFLNIYRISRANNCVGVCFKLNLKETPTQVFSSEIYEIFMNTYFEEYLRTTTSAFPRIYKT